MLPILLWLDACPNDLVRVAITKAAVKNMLRLMEAEPAGSPELDQYAEFVLQQDEIMIGDRTPKQSAMIDPRDGDVWSNVRPRDKTRDSIDASTYACTSVLDTSVVISGVRQPNGNSTRSVAHGGEDGVEPEHPVDGVGVNRSSGAVGAIAVPGSDMRLSSISSESRPAQGALGLDFTNSDSVGETMRVDGEECPGENVAGKSATTVSVAVGSTNRVVDDNSMLLEPAGAITIQAVELPGGEKGAQAEKDWQGEIGTAQGKIDESDVIRAGCGLDIGEASLGSRSASGDPKQQSTVTGVAAAVAMECTDNGEAGADLGNPAIALSPSGEERGPHNESAPTVPGLSSGAVGRVVVATLTPDDSAELPPKMLSQIPPLETEAALVTLAAGANSAKAPNTLVAVENLSNEDRKSSQRAGEMSANVSPNPVTGLGTCKKRSIEDPPLVTAGICVATIGGVPSASAIRDAPITSKASSFANQLPACTNAENSTAATTIASALGSSHLSARERLLRRVRTSMDGSVSPSTSDSDAHEVDDREEIETDRLNDNPDASALGADEDEEKVHQQSREHVADQPNERRDAIDATSDHDRISSNNEVALSPCQYMQDIGISLVAADSTGAGDGETRDGLPLITPSGPSHDVRPLNNASENAGEGGGTPSIKDADVADCPPSAVTQEQRAVERERHLGRMRKDDIESSSDEKLDDGPRDLDGTSSPAVGPEHASSIDTPVEDEGVGSGTEGLGEGSDNRIDEGTTVENEVALPKPDLVHVEDGNGGRHDRDPVASLRDLPVEAKVGSDGTRSVDGEQARDEGKVGKAVDTEGEVLVDANVEQAVHTADTEPEWIEGYDPSHDCYYYHHVATGESSWYKPDAPYEPYVHSDEDDDVVDSEEEEPVEEIGGDRKELETRLSTKGGGDHRSSQDEGTSGIVDVKDRAQSKDLVTTLHRAEYRHEQRKMSATAPRAGRRKRPSSSTADSRRRSSRGSEDTSSRSGSESCSTSRSYDGSRVRKIGRSEKKDTRRRDDVRSSGESTGRAGKTTKTRGGDVHRRQSAKKSALDRLNNLTDENITASDATTSDIERRAGGRRDRRHCDADGKRGSTARRSSDGHRAGHGSSPGRARSGARHGETEGSSLRRRANIGGSSSRKYLSLAVHRDHERGASFREADGSGSGRENKSNHRSSHDAGRASESRRTSSRRS